MDDRDKHFRQRRHVVWNILNRLRKPNQKKTEKDSIKKEMDMKGTIKFFSESRGFGFIIQDNGEKDIFVHFTDIKECVTKDGRGHDFPKDNDRVTYTIAESDRGTRAKDVVVTKEEEDGRKPQENIYET